jgi:hypothetical protein
MLVPTRSGFLNSTLLPVVASRPKQPDFYGIGHSAFSFAPQCTSGIGSGVRPCWSGVCSIRVLVFLRRRLCMFSFSLFSFSNLGRASFTQKTFIH